MSRPLVIAVGNPLRGDDGFGPHVAEQLAAARPDVDVIITQQLAPEMAEAISAASVVAFVDVRAGDPPGQVAVRTVPPGDELAGPLSHHFNPGLLLTMARELYGRCPPALELTVGAESFGHRPGFSPPVAAATTEALAQLGGILGRPGSAALS